MPQAGTPIVAIRTVLAFLGVTDLPAIRIADTILKHLRLGFKSDSWSQSVPRGERVGVKNGTRLKMLIL
jgi:hypothetical protein